MSCIWTPMCSGLLRHMITILHAWENVSLNWSVGQNIRIRVVEATPVPPGPPTNLVATSGDKKVTLSWKLPANADSTTLPITEYEFRVSEDGGSTWNPDWETIPESRSGQDNRMNYTVGNGDDYDRYFRDGLVSGKTYTFEIRAKGGDGPGAASAQLRSWGVRRRQRISTATAGPISSISSSLPMHTVGPTLASTWTATAWWISRISSSSWMRSVLRRKLYTDVPEREQWR